VSVSAPQRQHRTFLPPPEYNPLAPSHDPAHPTEVPAAAWDVAVFENRFASLTPRARDAPDTLVPTPPAIGACEVVVSPVILTAVWARSRCRTWSSCWRSGPTGHRALGERPDVDYALPFENRGVEVGVTLHHPTARSMRTHSCRPSRHESSISSKPITLGRRPASWRG
jgi:UDPglucose--hexose-1-phosphate uridylyltransferase